MSFGLALDRRKGAVILKLPPSLQQYLEQENRTVWESRLDMYQGCVVTVTKALMGLSQNLLLSYTVSYTIISDENF